VFRIELQRGKEQFRDTTVTFIRQRFVHPLNTVEDTNFLSSTSKVTRSLSPEPPPRSSRARSNWGVPRRDSVEHKNLDARTPPHQRARDLIRLFRRHLSRPRIGTNPSRSEISSLSSIGRPACLLRLLAPVKMPTDARHRVPYL
jgi:hypothetical protein